MAKDDTENYLEQLEVAVEGKGVSETRAALAEHVIRLEMLVAQNPAYAYQAARLLKLANLPGQTVASNSSILPYELTLDITPMPLSRPDELERLRDFPIVARVQIKDNKDAERAAFVFKARGAFKYYGDATYGLSCPEQIQSLSDVGISYEIKR